MNTEAATDGMVAPSLDSTLELVADRQRRQIIRELREDTAGTATVAELVEALADGESIPATDGPPDRSQLSIRLLHTQLPTLDDHGIVQYDRDNGVVRYTPDEQIETVLDSLPPDAVRVASKS